MWSYFVIKLLYLLNDNVIFLDKESLFFPVQDVKDGHRHVIKFIFLINIINHIDREVPF